MAGTNVTGVPGRLWVVSLDRSGPLGLGLSAKYTSSRRVCLLSDWYADDYWLVDAYVSFSGEALSDLLRSTEFAIVANNLSGCCCTWLTSTFDWVLMAAANLFLLFCLLLVTPFGRVRLGGPRARPDYSTVAWFAMLFAAGVGIGLMFFGVAEPVAHFLQPPLGGVTLVGWDRA